MRAPPEPMPTDVRSPQNKWEIAHQGFGEGWYRLGTSEGPTPSSALESWTRDRRHLRPGTYGVRSSGERAWQPFRVDASGVHGPSPDG